MRIRCSTLAAGTALFAATLLSVSGCAPTSLGYLNVEDARIVDHMRLDGHYHESMLNDAVGVAILDATTVGVAIGVTSGHGVVMRRLGEKWSPPVPVSIVSGSIGLQLGGKHAKMLMIFRSNERFDSFVFDNTDFVAEATGTAGIETGGAGNPLHKEDVELIADVDGFYGGAVIGGIGVSINTSLMHEEYGHDANAHDILSGNATTPPGALAIWTALDG